MLVMLVKDDRVLLAADAVMPLPYFVDGSFEQFRATLEGLRDGNFENIVQGHGDVILRGEIEEKLENDLHYLNALDAAVERAFAEQRPDTALNAVDLERCGKSRILLQGSAERLHRENVRALARQRRDWTRLPGTG
jgi:hypothetical protein